MKKSVIALFPLFISGQLIAQEATLTESVTTMDTYGFADPNPVADPSENIYPYWRFDQFDAKKSPKQWKTVKLENPYIQVTLFPEIGGKIWGAIDKLTGKEFVYYNHVVKFRDIAMRGAWVSGGIEFNFGIIGHVPTSSTPVDYYTQTKEDGSVSCYISSYELITRTLWTVEVNVPKDKAYFTTSVVWSNSSPLEQPYYQWMNAAFKAGGNLQICFPGNTYIGHEGDAHPFPKDAAGHNLSWYSQNAFGADKSYHVLGEYAGYYGAFWHDDHYGFAHCSRHDEKLGRKFFAWGQARSGAIWEDLLTLSWAAKQETSWKLDYYRGLILWKNGQPDKALTFLNRCDKCGYAPLFISRAKLKQGEERLNDLRRAEQLDASWRVGNALVKYFVENQDWEQACTTAEKYFKQHPDKFEIGLPYAQSLCELGKYDECVNLLSRLQVMPKEGARSGHIIYRKAKLLQARDYLRNKKFSKAIKAVEESKIWNENLGVGKPYDELIDYTIENEITEAAKAHNWQKADSIQIK